MTSSGRSRDRQRWRPGRCRAVGKYTARMCAASGERSRLSRLGAVPELDPDPGVALLPLLPAGPPLQRVGVEVDRDAQRPDIDA